MPQSAPKVAVVLAGCGRADGSEVQESVSCLIHLSRHGATYRCFAPDKPLIDTINHATGKPVAETRNALVEAARISRGNITPLAQLDPMEFDAIVFPGGFGAAKNLCTFAKDGPNCQVEPDVERVIRTFHEQKKPIGLCCIAPVLAARVLGQGMGGPGCQVTIGDDPATAGAIRAMGSANVPMNASEAFSDGANRVHTTPAYMFDASAHDVFVGIGRMIDSVVDGCRR
jgi:enhancing lycopene biosynthesis protein 2